MNISFSFRIWKLMVNIVIINIDVDDRFADVKMTVVWD